MLGTISKHYHLGGLSCTDEGSLDDTYGSARGMVQQQQQEQQLLSGKGSIVDRKHTHSPSIDRLNALKRSIAHSFAQCERRILAL